MPQNIALDSKMVTGFCTEKNSLISQGILCHQVYHFSLREISVGSASWNDCFHNKPQEQTFNIAGTDLSIQCFSNDSYMPLSSLT